MCNHAGAAPKKTVCSGCGTTASGCRDRRTHVVRDLDAGATRIYLAFEYRRVACPTCNAVKRETLSWLAQSARFTQRFEDRIGQLCREMTVTRVAELHNLSWDQVWRMEKSYMRRLLEQHPPSAQLRAIGVDEISIRKGHSYAIVVADLDEKRPIWLGGQGRTEQDMQRFFDQMGPERCQSIEVAVMDMWKPFRKATLSNAPSAQIVYDKFHIMRHLADALDQVRRSEYKRVNDKERRFIKGQRYTLLSHKANLDLEGRRALRVLLKANRRLHKAYLLKESFGQLWDYNNPTWARKFFESWKSQLRWQRLKPFEKFAAMIERHWEGIVSYCQPDHKVSLGFMEGLNNKIRVIQRRAYGIKDQEYLMLKVITSFIKEPKST
jgi:transposase